MSRKATFLFVPCYFVSGGRTSSFCEFYLFLIAIFISNIVLVASVRQAFFFFFEI